MKSACIAVALFFALFESAFAQKWEVSGGAGFFRPSRAKLGSLNDKAQDDDTVLKAGAGFGGRVTYNPWSYYGFEIFYAQSKPTFQTKIRTGSGRNLRETMKSEKVVTQQAAVNFLIYFMPVREKWRPFITGGINAHRWGVPKSIEEFTHAAFRNYGANYGGGIKFHLLPHSVIRLDVRDYFSGKPYDLKFADDKLGGGILRQFEASASIGFTF
jgi:hypothetical protein